VDNVETIFINEKDKSLILYDRKLSIILFEEKKYFIINNLKKNILNCSLFDYTSAITVLGLTSLYILYGLSKLLVEDHNDNSEDNIDVDLPQIDLVDKNITLKEKDVFKSYVDKVYSIKSNPKNSSQKAMAKSLLNNLLGRFGINLDKPITKIMKEVKYREISLMHKVTSIKQITKDKVLVSYIPKLDYDIISSHNLDFLKVLRRYKDK
jgi:hypothetical protein